MTRRHRRLIAWIGVLGMVFAQVALTAHAGAIGGADVLTAVPQLHTGHCAGTSGAGAMLAPPGNACEVHCTDGAQFAATPDLPPVALTSWAATPLPAAIAFDPGARDRSVLSAKGAAPPPLIQYCRFLI